MLAWPLGDGVVLGPGLEEFRACAGESLNSRKGQASCPGTHKVGGRWESRGGGGQDWGTVFQAVLGSWAGEDGSHNWS